MSDGTVINHTNELRSYIWYYTEYLRTINLWCHSKQKTILRILKINLVDMEYPCLYRHVGKTRQTEIERQMHTKQVDAIHVQDKQLFFYLEGAMFWYNVDAWLKQWHNRRECNTWHWGERNRRDDHHIQTTYKRDKKRSKSTIWRIPYTNEKLTEQSDNTNFNYTTIADRLGSVS